jgi:hypothetical protein
MADSRAEDLFKKQGQMEQDRVTLDAHCKEVAERCLPRQDNFLSASQVEGEKRTEKIFDATAVLALDRAASAIDSLITPATQQYHRLEPEDDRLLEDRETVIFLEKLNRFLFRMRYRAIANFASQAHECYVSLMAFGTQGLFIDDLVDIGMRGTRYKSTALSELYIAENSHGIVDYVHRKFPLSARAAVQKWRGRVPEKIQKEAELNPFKKFEFLHCVKPNEEVIKGRRDYTGMPFRSYFASYEGKSIVGEGGYRTMPYAVSRHVTAPRETYGRSPAMMVLPDIKMVNEMEKTTIRAAHKVVSPPLLLYGDGILSAFSTRPDAMNYGGVDEQGRQLVHPLKTGANLPLVFEMSEQKRKLINDAFFVTLFQILVQNPQMTATEALIRAQEKGQLLAPTVGRQQSELLGPVIAREIDIAAMSGMLPPMPPKLARAGGSIKAVYTSPLTRLRRAEEGVAIIRSIDSVTPLLEIHPEILDNVDTDEMLRRMWEINGAPADVLRSPTDVATIRAQRQKAQAEAAEIDAAQKASMAMKNVASAKEKMPVEAEAA